MTSAQARPGTARAGTGLVPGPGRKYRVSLAWPRLPAAAEVAIVAAGYAGYALVRLAVRASRPAAVAHAAGLWRAERWLHLDIEPPLNHLAAARPVLAETAGFYYGLAHFIVTPLVLAWLWLRRPAAFGPLLSALVLATTAANVVFWTWPAAALRNFQDNVASRLTGMVLAEHDVIQADDMLVIRGSYEATQSGEFLGVPPTGRRVAYDFIDMYKVTGGRIVWRYLLCDWKGLRDQLTAAA